ncbi:MAG: hypothetical protein ACK5K7_04755 [Bacilli bacterium]
MNHFDKKIGKIIDELTTFLLKKKCNDIEIKVHKDTTNTQLTFQFQFNNSKILELLEETLSQERDECIEEYGWELLGENDCSGELNLVGMCMDSFDVEINDDIAKIFLTRKN